MNIDNNNIGKRILSIDFGKKRVGFAITDPLCMFAYSLKTIENNKYFWDNFQAILEEFPEIDLILLGYPLKEDGTETDATKPVEKFLKQLKNKVNLKIILRDERYTSKIAYQRIIETVPSRKKRRDKSLIDKGSAAVLLEEYLSEIK